MEDRADTQKQHIPEQIKPAPEVKPDNEVKPVTDTNWFMVDFGW